MMKFLYALTILFILSCSTHAQNCNTDSVVVTFIRDRGDDFTNTFQYDTFDLTTGLHRPGLNVYFKQTLELSPNKDTLNYIRMIGTGSGFENSKKINFTYDAQTFLPLTRMEYNGIGNIWNIKKSETWNYNANNLITDYTYTDSIGNVQKIIYTYSGNNRQSILYQTGSGANWTNDRLFNIVYSGNSRDSLLVKKWDPNLSTWDDSISAKYDNNPPYYAVLSSSYIQGPTYYSNTYVYDTLDLLQNESYSDSTPNGIYSTTYINYIYVHSNKLISRYSLYRLGCNNTTQHFIYDTTGVLLAYTYDGHCGIGSGGSEDFTYDANYILTNRNTTYYSSVSDNFHYWDYFYLTSNSLSLDYIPTSSFGNAIQNCTGDSIRPVVIAGGGCGPLHYQWSPSSGLSSDTVAQPMIYLSNDTVSYTITATDTTGHSDQATFDAIPSLVAKITFDTTACQGCPVVLNVVAPAGATILWYRNDTLITTNIGATYTAINSGDYFAKVQSNNCIAYTDTVSLTLSGLTRISGIVYWDRDTNCTYSLADTAMSMFGFSPFLIRISRGTYNANLSLDASGVFDLPIDTGTFKIQLISATNLLNPVCNGSDSLIVIVPAFGDTLSGNDFALKGTSNCKKLEVHVSSGQFRPCLSSTIYINYSNASLIQENNGSITVTIPSELSVTNASLPFTSLGNKYTFGLPVLPIGETGYFTVDVDVICNTNLINASLCIDAEIGPVDFCSLHPDSTWDGSNVRVNSYCNNDSSVCFTLSNESPSLSGDMQTSSIWRLYNDNVLQQQGTFILNANTDTTLCFSSDGSTYRLEVDQTPGFPAAGPVRANIERCGPDTNNFVLGEISKGGFYNQLPFYYSYCRRISNAYDPNIKSVSPEGIGPNKFVSKYQRLNYRIDFQNTGNDTAFNAVVEDFLPSYWFELTTFEYISSSSPCTIEIVNNIVKFKFDNINLPDSGTNQQNSHGYIEFSIKPNQNLTNGSTIKNSANIYFDFNPAIPTPQVQNKICDVVNPSVTIQIDSNACIGKPIKAKALIQNGGTFPLPTINWYYNGTVSLNHTDSIILPSVKLNDTLYCTVQSTAQCAYPQLVQSAQVIFDHYQIPTPQITFLSPNLIASAAHSYQWLLNDTLLNGATSQSITPAVNGNYQVQVWDSSGCTALSEPINFLSTGIKNNPDKNLRIFPNPAQESITIEYPSTIHSIRIMDNMGQTLIFEKTNSSSLKLSVKSLNVGRYIVEITTEDGRAHKPLIVLEVK
jgi:hypothetical protein